MRIAILLHVSIAVFVAPGGRTIFMESSREQEASGSTESFGYPVCRRIDVAYGSRPGFRTGEKRKLGVLNNAMVWKAQVDFQFDRFTAEA
jgi:hypothetical protein